MLLHEGQSFDPVMRDIEAFFDASQAVVTGSVRVRLFKGSAFVLGAESAHSMFATGVATYGEENRLWDGRDAEGFTARLRRPRPPRRPGARRGVMGRRGGGRG